ncbi:MAG: polysaccharide biosynthesis protein, partial [Acidimicrobiia bacterium]|nr:polysaccharide biosynthesis protein [Acidimicrobiia bacterium]
MAAFATTATVFVVVWSRPGPNLVPLSAVLAAGAYLSIGAFGVRYILRLVVERSSPHRIGTERLLVFGAGDAGYQAAKALLHDPASDLTPVAFLDDDVSKRSLRLLGLRVVGGRGQIAAAAAEYQASSLLIAIPAAPHGELVKIADAGIDAGLAVKILPSLSKIALEGIRVKNIREIELADFLDREETHLDLKAIGGYITGKRILVTGAGGSIGTQLCQTLMRFAPSAILALDHAENNLHRLGLSAAGDSSETPLHLTLGDVRDAGRMLALFEEYRPDVVFHTAAHKHVPFLEEFPEEATKTNVFGTLNVLQAAHKAQVGTFVNISTDKAADPISALGITKRTAELLTSYYSTFADGKYLSVRFGNVLGSDGSVIPTFREQLRQNKPLTITHPDATRYFMTVAEAVELVIQAGSMGTENDLFVLDMGEPVRIVDLARRLSAALRPGMPLQIEEIGLRHGEKLHEVLFHDSDESVEKPHDRIWRCRVEPL